MVRIRRVSQNLTREAALLLPRWFRGRGRKGERKSFSSRLEPTWLRSARNRTQFPRGGVAPLGNWVPREAGE